MKLKEMLKITQSEYKVVNSKNAVEINENKYLENEVDGLVIVIDKNNFPCLHICVKVNA